jgi:ribonuclease P protein component
MLKKVNRLKKRYQFSYVYKAGQHFSGRAMVLYATTSKTKDIKVGFAVTKKIGHATKRNLVRRRLREIVKKQLPNLKQNYNIIVVAKDGITDFEFSYLESEFVGLLKKAELIKDEKII